MTDPSRCCCGLAFSGLLKPNIERLKDAYRPRLQAILSASEEHLPEITWSVAVEVVS